MSRVAVRAALRQQEHKLQEEGLRITQLVEEFKFKQKTIGLLKDKDASMRELKQLSAQSAKRLMELAGDAHGVYSACPSGARDV